MTNIMGIQARQDLVLGRHVQKSSGAQAAATTSLFTVTGLVLVTGLIGYVTTAMDGTTTSININHDPTIGSAVNLDAPTVVTSDVVGTIYSRLTLRTGLIVSEGTTAPNSAYTVMGDAARVVLAPGVIGSVGTAADVGVVLWHLFYVPVSDDGLVVPA